MRTIEHIIQRMRRGTERPGMPIKRLCICTLLTLHAALAFFSVMNKSATFDEPVHLAGGYSYWRTGDYRINPEAGILPQRLAALPLLFLRDIDYEPTPFHPNHEAQQWNQALAWLYAPKNNSRLLLLCGRSMIIASSLLLALAIFTTSRSIWGFNGGIISLLCYCLSPTILAHARLISSDTVASLLFFLAVAAIWHMMQHLNPGRIITAGICIGLLLTAKFSAVIILPVYILIIGVRLYRRRCLPVTFPELQATIHSRWKMALSLIACGTVQIIIAAAVIWCLFGFKFDMSPNLADESRQIIQNDIAQYATQTGLPGAIAEFAAEHNLLPQAYIFGFLFTCKNAKTRHSFLHGEHRTTGWWYYFPYAFAIKTPLPTLILIIITLITAAGRLRFAQTPKPTSQHLTKRTSLTIYKSAPYIMFLLIYSAFALTSNLNLGIRHLLPAYPAGFVLLGGAGRLINAKRLTMTVLIAACLAWLGIENIRIFPHYIAYFNQLAGGPENGYNHLVDSNLDWGQDLYELREFIKNHQAESPDQKIFVSYFGSAPLDLIDAEILCLPSFFEQRRAQFFGLSEGIYCISATMLQHVYQPKLAHWTPELEQEYQTCSDLIDPMLSNPKTLTDALQIYGRDNIRQRYRHYENLRFARLCSYLRNRKPDHQIGHSILVFKLQQYHISKLF